MKIKTENVNTVMLLVKNVLMTPTNVIFVIMDTILKKIMVITIVFLNVAMVTTLNTDSYLNVSLVMLLVPPVNNLLLNVPPVLTDLYYTNKLVKTVLKMDSSKTLEIATKPQFVTPDVLLVMDPLKLIV